MKTNTNRHIDDDKWMDDVIEEVNDRENNNDNYDNIFDSIEQIFRQGEQAGLCNWIRF